VALAAEFVSLGAVSRAQEERPQIITGERKVARKKDAGPRAVAVLQVTANGKASLVPIAILINGKFWDASAYKANPVPMALETGTVYEAERTGNSQGLFTVGSALHSNAANAQTPWIGTGAWVPAGTEKPNAAVKAEGVPKGIDTTDDRPRLTRNPQPATSGGQTSAQASAQGAKASDTSPPTSSSQSSGQASGPSSASSSDEPPRLKRPAEDANSGAPTQAPAQAGSSQTGASASGSDAKQDQSQPAQGQTSQSQAGQTRSAQPQGGEAKPAATQAAEAKPPESDSGAAEGNRPRLRRGKPTQPFSDEDFPGYSKPGVTPAKAGKAETTADKGPVQFIPAISDAGGPTPRPFTFEWLKDEEGDRRQQITELAKQQLKAYLDAQEKKKIAPKAAAAQTRHAKAVKAPEPILSNAQMTTYDLWTNNQPILVFSAEAHMPPPATPGPGYSDVAYSIMLVARTGIYNNLRPLYSGVTDKVHLDLTRRLELVDAVDADGDGRGELLFKETSDAGTGFVIYRATADKLWKMYDSLNPE